MKAKKSIIIALAAATGASAASIKAAEAQAMKDMADEFGKKNICVQYTYDPFDGMYA